MKKLLCGLLALMMIISFTACGKKTETNDPDDQTGTDVTDTTDPTNPDTPDDTSKTDDNTTTDTPSGNDKTDTGTQGGTSSEKADETVWDGGEYDIEAAMNNGVIFSKLTGAEKEAFIKACEDNGIDVTFNGGTTIMSESDGYKLEQYSDGTMKVTDSEGFTAIVGYSWGSGPLTKLVSKPNFGTVDMYTETDDAMIVQISNVTLDNYNTYLKDCKSKGFTNVQYETSADNEAVFVATDSKGYTLALSLEEGVLMISIGVPEE